MAASRNMWVHSVEIAVPCEEAWRRVSAVDPGQFSPSSAPLVLNTGETLRLGDRVAVSGGPKDFAATISREGSSFRVTLQVDPESSTVAVQGEWWFRGVFRVQPVDPQRTRLLLEVYNVARAPWHVFVPLVARGARDQTYKDLTAIAQQLESRAAGGEQ